MADGHSAVREGIGAMRRLFVRRVWRQGLSGAALAVVLLGLSTSESRALPSPDRDRDLIVDSQDNCPEVYNVRQDLRACQLEAGFLHWIHLTVDQFGYPLSAPGFCLDQVQVVPRGPGPWPGADPIYLKSKPCMFTGAGAGAGTMPGNSYAGALNITSNNDWSWSFGGSLVGTAPEGCAAPQPRNERLTTPAAAAYRQFFWVFTCPDADGDQIRNGLDLCPGKPDPPGITASCVVGTPPQQQQQPPPQAQPAPLPTKPIVPPRTTLQKFCESPLTSAGSMAAEGSAGLGGFLLAESSAAAATAATVGGAALGVTGMGCRIVSPPPPSSPAFADVACGTLGSASLGLAAGAFLAAPTGVGGLLLGGLGLLAGAGSMVACSADPPDPSFRTLAQPTVPVVSLAPRKGVSKEQANLIVAVTRNALESLAVGRAMTLCINRASGAAAAKETTWEKRQRACASDHARHVASLYRKQVSLRRAALSTLRAARVANVKVGFGARQAAIALLKSPPSQMRSELRRMGFTSQDLAFARQTVDRPTYAGNVPADLYAAIAGPKTLAALTSAANAFDQIASTYRK